LLILVVATIVGAAPWKTAPAQAGNNTWTAKSSGLVSLGLDVQALAIDPNATSTVYATTTGGASGKARTTDSCGVWPTFVGGGPSAF
jgi:hypothetical protein